MIWAATAGGPNDDYASGICIDPDGNIWITGTCGQGTVFDNLTLNLDVSNAPYCFLVKYSSSGTCDGVISLGPTTKWPNFKAWGLKIRYDNSNPSQPVIWIQGKYSGQIQYDVAHSLPKTNDTVFFTAKCDNKFDLLTLMPGATDNPDDSKNYGFDPDGNQYETGAFISKKTFGTITLTSKGMSDIYIDKHSNSTGESDSSDASFTIESPQFNFRDLSIDMKTVKVGSSGDSVFNSELCNYGHFPITISSAYLIGPNASDFALGVNQVGVTIDTGQCITIEIIFTPSDTGRRTAQLIINDNCYGSDTLNLSGKGIKSGSYVPLVLSENDALIITPNPTNQSINIDFSINMDSYVSLILSNSLGIRAATIIDNQFYSAGSYRLDYNLSSFEQGVFFLTLKKCGISKTVKVMIIK